MLGCGFQSDLHVVVGDGGMKFIGVSFANIFVSRFKLILSVHYVFVIEIRKLFYIYENG